MLLCWDKKESYFELPVLRERGAMLIVLCGCCERERGFVLRCVGSIERQNIVLLRREGMSCVV